MVRIERKTQKIFASNTGADQITAFGTAKTTNPEYTTDVAEIQSDVYLQGWEPSLVSDLAPYLQDSNGLWYATTKQMAYLFQEGIAEWDVDTEYGLNSICKSGDTLYISLQNNNIGHLISEPTYWKIYSDTDSKILTLLQALYPVGSLYITANNSCPMSILIPNSEWQLVAQDRALWGGWGNNGNTTKAAGLPNITGGFVAEEPGGWGAFWQGGSTPGHVGYDGKSDFTCNFDARRVSSIYGSSGTVQPPAYVVNVYRRTA